VDCGLVFGSIQLGSVWRDMVISL